MDTQTLSYFVHIHTEGAAHSIFHYRVIINMANNKLRLNNLDYLSTHDRLKGNESISPMIKYNLSGRCRFGAQISFFTNLLHF